MSEHWDPGALTPLLSSTGCDAPRVVRPGDVLVVSYPGALTPAEAEHVRVRLAAQFSDLADVVVFQQLRFEFVYRKDES